MLRDIEMSTAQFYITVRAGCLYRQWKWESFWPDGVELQPRDQGWHGCDKQVPADAQKVADALSKADRLDADGPRSSILSGEGGVIRLERLP